MSDEMKWEVRVMTVPYARFDRLNRAVEYVNFLSTKESIERTLIDNPGAGIYICRLGDHDAQD